MTFNIELVPWRVLLFRKEEENDDLTISRIQSVGTTVKQVAKNDNLSFFILTQSNEAIQSDDQNYDFRHLRLKTDKENPHVRAWVSNPNWIRFTTLLETNQIDAVWSQFIETGNHKYSSGYVRHKVKLESFLFFKDLTENDLIIKTFDYTYDINSCQWHTIDFKSYKMLQKQQITHWLEISVPPKKNTNFQIFPEGRICFYFYKVTKRASTSKKICSEDVGRPIKTLRLN